MPNETHRASARYKNSPFFSSLLGDYYSSRGRAPEALASYRAAVQTDPSSAIAHYKLGLGLEEARDQQGAQAELESASRLLPKSGQPHIALGDLLSNTGREDAAILEYTTAAKVEPESGTPYVESGTPYVRIAMTQQKEGQLGLPNLGPPTRNPITKGF